MDFWVSAAEKVAIEELWFLDLYGKPVTLRPYFQNHLLLIFLRHLA
jgi:hypothetical protein